MSAGDHDGKKDDKGGAANYSAINLNKDFLQKLKEDGECLGGSHARKSFASLLRRKGDV